MRLLLTLPSCLLCASVIVFGIMGPDTAVPRVSLPSSNSTNSFWLHLPPEDSPLANVGSTGSLTQDADICVIGSGITGVGVVWHLVKDLENNANTKVVLLEARQFCKGFFSSHFECSSVHLFRFRSYWYLPNVPLRRITVCSSHKIPGRNGGHLSPRIFYDFVSLEKSYGRAEAVKTFLLERHTTDTLLKFLEDRPGFAEQVDLVSEGTMEVMRGHEETQAKKDWEGAKNAGVNMGKKGIRWLSRDKMVEVGCNTFLFFPSWIYLLLL